MKREIDLPERVVFTPTPEPLLQLCLECRRANCNGECDDYSKLERKIRMNTSAKRPRNAGTQNAPEPERLRAGSGSATLGTEGSASAGRASEGKGATAIASDSYLDVVIPAPKERIAPEPSPVSKMDIVPLCAPPHEAVAQARGLKLWNLTIEALDKLLDEGDMEEVGSFAGMLKSLKRQRFELFGDRIDWHALEEE